MKITLFFLIISLFSTYRLVAQHLYISKVHKLSDNVNSKAEESMPVFDLTNSILYFTRTYDTRNKGKNDDQDIWYAKLINDTTFSPAQNLIELNNKYNNTVFSTTGLGKKLFVLNSYFDKNLEKSLAFFIKDENNWNNKQSIQIDGLTNEKGFYGFYVNEEETVLFVSYSGKDSFGSEDLYVSEKIGDSWSELINLGSTINTEGFEISPFLKGDTLFFSSNGHGGFGNADIFYTIKQNSWTEWTKPVNLGKEVNSAKFDAYFTYSNNRAYWSSNRANQYSDIYTCEIETIKPIELSYLKNDVSIFNGSDGSILPIISGGKGPYTYKWSTGTTDSLLSQIPKGIYRLTVVDKIGQMEMIEVEIQQPENFITLRDKKLDIKVGDDLAKKLELNPIYFNLNSAVLRADSFNELDKIVQVMNENPKMKIHIESHTDCRSSYKYNLTLSEKRSKSTVDYISSRIINPERLSGKGYGETQLLNDCECEGNVYSSCSEEEHQLNRRTEFRILEY